MLLFAAAAAAAAAAIVVVAAAAAVAIIVVKGIVVNGIVVDVVYIVVYIVDAAVIVVFQPLTLSLRYLTLTPTTSICATPLYFPASDTKNSTRSPAGTSRHVPTSSVESFAAIDEFFKVSLRKKGIKHTASQLCR